MDHVRDVNIEHLLDVFTSADAKSKNVWDACIHFIYHLYRHKPRLVITGPKIEALPDDHPSKPYCLGSLSALFYAVGNYAKQKRILTHALELWRGKGVTFRLPKRVDAAEEAASHAIPLLQEDSEQYQLCQAYRTLGNVQRPKGKKAIHHFEMALGISSI